MSFNRTEAVLADLGSTTDEIVASLVKFRIKGTPHKADACPLAKYLKWKGAFTVAVGPSTASVSWNLNDDVVMPEDVDLTEAQSIFVGEFDSGYFPELEV